MRINANTSWVQDLDSIFTLGVKSAPRDMTVYECVGYKTIVPMNFPVITIPERNLGYKFMAAEAAWILSGDNKVGTIKPYSKVIAQFSDDGETFFGAYGPKIKDQVNYVVETLSRDQDSRQAVVNIWRENPGLSKDIPCTLSLQFLLRKGVLHCVASMRSSDLWLGHPYDIVNFSAVSFYVLLQLQNEIENFIELGELHLTAGSKHIYERNVDGVSVILDKYGFGGEGHVSMREIDKPIFDNKKYEAGDEFVVDLWDAANSKDGMLTFMK